jgi:UDP-glucose 4-epimerase
MRIAVLGGSGFLGSHVADALSEAGHSVVIFDRVVSPWLRRGQEMVRGDILDGEAVASAVAGAEAVYNFAGVAELDEADKSPVHSAEINIIGNLQVCEACARYKVRRYIFASTLYVYSRLGGAYRCSKQACETYIEYYRQTHGLEYTVLRYGSLYGPRSSAANGIHHFIHQAITAGRIDYYGNPDALREYIHVSDAALASVEVLQPEFVNRHVILSGNQAIRVSDLFHMISEVLGKKIECLYHTGSLHYVTTPYSFNPQVGVKYSSRLHVDLGQGLLLKIEEIFHQNTDGRSPGDDGMGS